MPRNHGHQNRLPIRGEKVGATPWDRSETAKSSRPGDLRCRNTIRVSYAFADAFDETQNPDFTDLVKA